jgi:hypothetical protein
MNKQANNEVKPSTQKSEQHQQKAASDKHQPSQPVKGAAKPTDSGKQKS